jgi:HlyD family secretion protein
MPRSLNETEIRSEEVQDILGRIPSWITRNGITLVIIVIAVLLIGSWIFKYPDIISAPVVVTTENPPANLLSKVNGKIFALYVTDKQKVVQGQLMAMIENPLNYDDLADLKLHLKWLKPFMISFDPAKKTIFRDNYALGEIQTEYADFLKKYVDYLSFAERNYYPVKILSLREQSNISKTYVERQVSKRKVMEEELSLMKNKFKRDSSLYKKGVISLEEYEKTRRELLERQYEYEGMRTVISESQLKLNEAEQSVIDIQNQSKEEQKALQLSLTEAWNKLMGAIDVWELKYLIKSPFPGEVTFSKFWSTNQNVAEGETVFTVIPDVKSRLVGKVQLKMAGAGKVKAGQSVNLKFDNYPYMQYGMVDGTVSRISRIPTNDYYALEVDLPNGLVSNYGKSFEFNQEIQGTAEIVTEDLRLLQRIFNPIRSLFYERVVR